MWVGLDVGLRRLHAVAIDEAGAVAWAAAFDPPEAVARLEGADGVAVDSPGAWSTAPHAADETVPRKFRLARCGEIDLGRTHGIWVPWSTPPEPAPGTWMATGIALFDALRDAGHDPVEAYAVERGDRIAQLVIQRVEQASFAVLDELPASERGLGGFGHSGR